MKRNTRLGSEVVKNMIWRRKIGVFSLRGDHLLGALTFAHRQTLPRAELKFFTLMQQLTERGKATCAGSTQTAPVGCPPARINAAQTSRASLMASARQHRRVRLPRQIRCAARGRAG